MSPPRRRSTYKAPRNRREVAVAVLSSLAIVVVTVVLVWVLRPNKDSASEPITTPVVTTAPPSTTAAPTDTTAAPADSAPTESTTPGTP